MRTVFIALGTSAMLVVGVAHADKRFVETSRPRDSREVEFVTWMDGSPESDLVLRDGVPFKILQVDGVTVVTSVHDVGKRFRLDVYIYNESEERFEVYPERLTFDVVSPKRKELQYVSMEKLQRSVKRKAAWAAALAGLGAGATETVTATTSVSGSATTSKPAFSPAERTHYSGTATTTMTVPDHEARAASRERVRQIHEQASDQLAAIEDIALQANTLLPGEEVAGSVFFQKDGDIREGVVTIPAGRRAYEFPVRLARVKN